MRLLKRSGLLAGAVMLGLASSAMAGYYQKHDFDVAWAGDYAPGWENTAYRHGPAPVGKMMEYVAGGRGGTGGMRLIADSTPESWMWWAAVNPTGVNSDAMKKQYDPWVSAWYYDPGWESASDLHAAGQLFAVPSWVNPYIPPGEDWTDIQFGARMNQAPPADNYYYVAAGEASPGWVDTTKDRANGAWVQLKMQLSSADGKVHFYLNGTEVGASYRDDYVDLGTEIGLYTMFTSPLSAWVDNKPSTIWDDFEFGSSIPLPSAAWSGMALLAGIGLVRRARRA
jgi:hypothetical protein